MAAVAFRCLLAAAVASLAGTARLVAQPDGAPRLETLEAMVEALAVKPRFAIDRPAEVASFVFAALKDRVKVYPTENYYYFRFLHDGVTYGGNFRLDPRDRDSGKIHFAYYEELAEWKPDGPEEYLVLDAAAGFAVERLRDLTYRITHGARSVVFELNDLSRVTPPPSALGADEAFIGPIFDESVMRFFLLYNRQAKSFLYVLDETTPPLERFDGIKESDRILVGRRTGFAFYRDHHLERKILIGAFRRNVQLNTWLDGPFDQLPENFIKGDQLLDAILDADPAVKGRIDRLGHYASGARYLVHPYMHYTDLSDLLPVEACASAKRQEAGYYRCFVNPPAR